MTGPQGSISWESHQVGPETKVGKHRQCHGQQAPQGCGLPGSPGLAGSKDAGDQCQGSVT